LERRLLHGCCETAARQGVEEKPKGGAVAAVKAWRAGKLESIELELSRNRKRNPALPSLSTRRPASVPLICVRGVR